MGQDVEWKKHQQGQKVEDKKTSTGTKHRKVQKLTGKNVECQKRRLGQNRIKYKS